MYLSSQISITLLNSHLIVLCSYLQTLPLLRINSSLATKLQSYHFQDHKARKNLKF
jgi:hypothetical protein